MPSPTTPNLHHRIKARLLDLSPRAFEVFACDLLVYVGLQDVAVTRFSGDGGIDAYGTIVTDSGLVRIKAGVQIKRYRHNVQRPDIDQFIGAYGGHYDRGIFITTAAYAAQALVKASTSPLLRVDTINGDQVAALMLRCGLGIAAADAQIDEPYFQAIEAQSAVGPAVREKSEEYTVGNATAAPTVHPEDDLISLPALSYALRVDRTTVQRWVERGRLTPDRQVDLGARVGFFFRRDRVEALRRELVRQSVPSTGEEWRQEFLDFARSRNLTRSYKPVMLQALLALADRDGAVPLDDLARAFHAFYLARRRDGLPTEVDGLMARPETARLSEVADLIVKYPLDRFIIQHFVSYTPDDGMVRFAPHLWQELRVSDLRDLQASTEEQLRFYYGRVV